MFVVIWFILLFFWVGFDVEIGLEIVIDSFLVFFVKMFEYVGVVFVLW